MSASGTKRTCRPATEWLRCSVCLAQSYGPNFPDLFRRAADFVDKNSARDKTWGDYDRTADQIRSRCQPDHRGHHVIAAPAEQPGSALLKAA